MKPAEDTDQYIEVKAHPRKYNGHEFPYDFNIDVANIEWGPTTVCEKTYVYSLFWSCEAKICEFYLSFESESEYDSYVAYLENLLSSLAKCQIGKCLHIFFCKINCSFFNCVFFCQLTEENFDYENDEPYLLSSTWNYGPVEHAYEIYESMNLYMEKMVNGTAVPSAGIKVLRPISILADLFKAKRRMLFNPKTKSPAKRAFISCEHKKKSFVTKLLKKKKKAISNIFSRKDSSKPPINNLIESSLQAPSIEQQTYCEPHVLDAIEEEKNLSNISTNENSDSIGANSSSMDSFYSCISSHNDSYRLWSQSQTSHVNLRDAALNENSIGSDTHIETDSLATFGVSNRTEKIDGDFEFDTRPPFNFDENENNRMQNETSLASFVTAADFNDENNNSASNLARTSLRRKLLYDDRSGSGLNDYSFCEQQSQCSDASFSNGNISTTIGSAPLISAQITYSQSNNRLDSVSLLSVAVACVKKRICTPYRLKNNVTDQLKLLATSASLDCLLLPNKIDSPTKKKIQAKMKAQTSTASNDDCPPSNISKAASAEQLHVKNKEAKSPSVPKSVLRRISNIRNMTMSLASASSRAISIFV